MKIQKIIINQDLIYQELDGEMVLLDMQSGQYYGLDSIGCRIWALLQQGNQPASIPDILVQEYDVPYDVCQKQVIDFIEQLIHANIVSIDWN